MRFEREVKREEGFCFVVCLEDLVVFLGERRERRIGGVFRVYRMFGFRVCFLRFVRKIVFCRK